MIIEVDGTQYSGWTEAVANIRLDTLSNAFRFNATAAKGKPLPFKGGEACTVFVDGEKVLTGHIEIVNIDMESDTHDITIDGRDNTGDILDSKIGILDDIKPPISLKQVLEITLKSIQSPIQVIEQFTPSLFKTVDDLIAAEPGQEVREFIEALARKKQVLLTADADGNMVITRSSGEEIDATLHHKINDNTNNVLNSSTSYDTTGRYNKYLIATQLDPLAVVATASITNRAISKQSSVVFDDVIRVGRQFALLSENSGSTPKERAEWEANVRKARGSVYSCTVNGYRNQTEELWKINTLVNVNDEQADIQSRMLINSIQFSLNEDGGRETTLSLLEKNAYTLELAEPDDDEVGGNFQL